MEEEIEASTPPTKGITGYSRCNHKGKILFQINERNVFPSAEKTLESIHFVFAQFWLSTEMRLEGIYLTKSKPVNSYLHSYLSGMLSEEEITSYGY